MLCRLIIIFGSHRESTFVFKPFTFENVRLGGDPAILPDVEVFVTPCFNPNHRHSHHWH